MTGDSRPSASHPTTDTRPFDPLVDQRPARFIVGIDLGTTNSAVAYVDTSESSWQVRDLVIPQLVAPGQVESRETLPSFHYQPAAGEMTPESLRLPWGQSPPGHVVGLFARDHGTRTPGRLIGSAKSWLCHSGVDRTADLLPWQAASDVDRLSPVEVSARFLRHMHDAWNARFPGEPLSKQDVVLTLPASFDEVARELTVEAAARANLPRVVLIEEPQAAFYAWVNKHARDWQERVHPGQKILVIDIGGGTTDLTLIRVRRADDKTREGGTIQFHRVAVGNHLILGGDNLDLALAHHLEQKLTPRGKLEPRQWSVLVRSCRQAKETLMTDPAPERLTIHLPGSGAKLIGGGLQVELTRDETRELILCGFLPTASLEEKPKQHRSGFQEFGLPYAPDAAITRYLAAFLTAHRHVALDADEPHVDHDPARPDVVLFNGGFFASPVLRDRVLEAIAGWFQGGASQAEPIATRGEKPAAWSPVILDHDRLDLAVARGAAYYGMVRRGVGVRIAATLARSYYISVDDDQPRAVCLVPGNAEPGQEIELTRTPFELLVSQPVEFPLYVSSTRLTDQPGDVVPIEPESLTPLPPIRTVLQTARRSERAPVTVHLHSRLTEIGTIDLWCRQVDGDRQWRLQFDIRSATQTDVNAHEGRAEQAGFIDEATWHACRARLESVFALDGTERPDDLVRQLSDAMGASREQWPPSLLRRIWETLVELESGRKKSAVHEARWLNLLGYALRPGYGFAVDDWRVTETWRLVYGKLLHAAPSGQTESLILWRRLAGGLSRGQQVALAEPRLATVRALHRRFQGKAAAGPLPSANESIEMWRLLGSLELLDIRVKLELGQMLVDLMPKRKLENIRPALVWALGRIGQRVPLYGPLNTIVPREKAESWIESLLDGSSDDRGELLATMQLARKTNDRHRDISEQLRTRVTAWLVTRRASRHLIELVERGGTLDREEQGQIFGESLPKGLRLGSTASETPLGPG